jgi:hypothetical protein
MVILGHWGWRMGRLGAYLTTEHCKKLWQTNLTLLLCVYHIITQHRQVGHPNQAQAILPMM